ncbi:hypothetical protein NDA14_004977 [Ustilago hordei]|uniref:Reverse transcriptase Ty1/copia-type domain-containing protein n=1 Tax=Ustilago hordei TaxID=120017 RepID=I2FPM5_USTHO|nr:hypothetical protein NDA10_002061 [Ustilago hordei]KAJ1597072.1 hypothetical protein NDA14_004977 [Ustilago hordei]CCF48868.1 uncharacterized protein UHOR_13433 [Ustilago hordei]
MTSKEDAKNLGYSEVNLLNETDQGLLSEYIDMEPIVGMDKNQELKLSMNSDSFGLTATDNKRERNLDPTVQEALVGPDKRLWEEAMQKELEGLEAMGTWKVKTDANLVPTKFKVRLVARGFTQREGVDYTKIFAPIVPIQSIRGVLAVVAVQDWEIDSVNIKQAYLNSNLHHDIYLKLLIRTKAPPGKENEITVITAYIDDMLIASPSHKEVDRTKKEIMNKWGMEDNGKIKEFLSIKITWDRAQRSISLDLMAYIKAMVSKWLQRMTEKSWVPM